MTFQSNINSFSNGKLSKSCPKSNYYSQRTTFTHLKHQQQKYSIIFLIQSLPGGQCFIKLITNLKMVHKRHFFAISSSLCVSLTFNNVVQGSTESFTSLSIIHRPLSLSQFDDDYYENAISSKTSHEIINKGFFLRGGGVNENYDHIQSKEDSVSGGNDNPMESTSTSNTPTSIMDSNKQNNELLLSIHSVQGKRPYMEDEYFTNQDGSFVAIFDGHGGNAVSRYLRQNLYARYLQAKATSTAIIAAGNHQITTVGENESEHKHSKSSLTVGDTNNDDEYIMEANKRGDDCSIKSCILALKAAFQKVDSDVNKISHWSFQGSTAVAILLHRTMSSLISSTPSSLSRSLDEKIELSSSPSIITNQNEENQNVHDQDNFVDASKTQSQITLISANVGDSRAVLSHCGKAIDLTRDHKPNDPMERKRIEKLGGKVVWCGPVHPQTGKPLDGSIVETSNTTIRTPATTNNDANQRNKINANSNFMKKRKASVSTSTTTMKRSITGIYRINGNLALSRAIGDRSEQPLVSSEVEINQFNINNQSDEFIILASDGLWDVMSSQEAVDYCHRKIIGEQTKIKNGKRTHVDIKSIKQTMAKYIVKEALRRGSMDNITVVIVWMSSLEDQGI